MRGEYKNQLKFVLTVNQTREIISKLRTFEDENNKKETVESEEGFMRLDVFAYTIEELEEE